MTKLKHRRPTAGMRVIDYRDNGYRPPDELQARADAAFDAWIETLPKAKRRGLRKRLTDEYASSRVVGQAADRRIEERAKLGPALARLMVWPPKREP